MPSPLIPLLRRFCSGDEEKMLQWLNRPNSNFYLKYSPVELICMGHTAVVVHHLNNLLTGQPS